MSINRRIRIWKTAKKRKGVGGAGNERRKQESPNEGLFIKGRKIENLRGKLH